jgi:hypothetical protein
VAALMRRRHRRVHRIAWLVLAVLLPCVLIAALVTRPSGPVEAPAIQLAPPR